MNDLTQFEQVDATCEIDEIALQADPYISQDTYLGTCTQPAQWCFYLCQNKDTALTVQVDKLLQFFEAERKPCSWAFAKSRSAAVTFEVSISFL